MLALPIFHPFWTAWLALVPPPASLPSPWATVLGLSLSTFRGRLSLGPVPGLGENGVCSGPAKPGLGCQPSQTISLQAVVLGRVPVPMGCISCSPRLPAEPQKGAARGGKELCLCLREPVWGLKTVYQLCGAIPLSRLSATSRKSQVPQVSQPVCGEGSASAPPGRGGQRSQPWKGISLTLTPQGEQPDGEI